MNNSVQGLPSGDFEVVMENKGRYVFPNSDADPLTRVVRITEKPYEFARDRKIQSKIDEQRERGKVEDVGTGQSQDKQGPGEGNSYVPFREW